MASTYQYSYPSVNSQMLAAMITLQLNTDVYNISTFYDCSRGMLRKEDIGIYESAA